MKLAEVEFLDNVWVKLELDDTFYEVDVMFKGQWWGPRFVVLDSTVDLVEEDPYVFYPGVGAEESVSIEWSFKEWYGYAYFLLGAA